MSLTARQTDVLRCLRLGLSDKEIAATLNVAKGTVKSHKALLFRALNVTNRTAAAMHWLTTKGETMDPLPPKPFNLTARRTDGYVVNIVESGKALSVTVTRTADDVSWRGVRDTVEEAVSLAARIVVEQQLIQQMHEGDTDRDSSRG